MFCSSPSVTLLHRRFNIQSSLFTLNPLNRGFSLAQYTRFITQSSHTFDHTIIIRTLAVIGCAELMVLVYFAVQQLPFPLIRVNMGESPLLGVPVSWPSSAALCSVSAIPDGWSVCTIILTMHILWYMHILCDLHGFGHIQMLSLTYWAHMGLTVL